MEWPKTFNELTGIKNPTIINYLRDLITYASPYLLPSNVSQCQPVWIFVMNSQGVPGNMKPKQQPKPPRKIYNFKKADTETLKKKVNELTQEFLTAYLTIEGASTLLVYGRHFFLYNFSLATILETVCYLNWTYLQKENMVKIQAHSTKPFSRYETCPLANVTLFDGHKIPFLSIKHNVHLKNTFLSLKSKLIM